MKCFRIEVGSPHPRPNILFKCAARFNKLNTASVRDYVKSEVPAAEPGRRKKNGKE